MKLLDIHWFDVGFFFFLLFLVALSARVSAADAGSLAKIVANPTAEWELRREAARMLLKEPPSTQEIADILDFVPKSRSSDEMADIPVNERMDGMRAHLIAAMKGRNLHLEFPKFDAARNWQLVMHKMESMAMRSDWGETHLEKLGELIQNARDANPSARDWTRVINVIRAADEAGEAIVEVLKARAPRLGTQLDISLRNAKFIRALSAHCRSLLSHD